MQRLLKVLVFGALGCGLGLTSCFAENTHAEVSQDFYDQAPRETSTYRSCNNFPEYPNNDLSWEGEGNFEVEYATLWGRTFGYFATIEGCEGNDDFSLTLASEEYTSYFEFHSLPLFNAGQYDFIIITGDESSLKYVILRASEEYREAFRFRHGEGNSPGDVRFFDTDNNGVYEISLRMLDEFRCSNGFDHGVIVDNIRTRFPPGIESQIISPAEVCEE